MKKVLHGVFLSAVSFALMWGFVWLLNRYQTATRLIILVIYAAITGFGAVWIFPALEQSEEHIPTQTTPDPEPGRTPKVEVPNTEIPQLKAHIEMLRDHAAHWKSMAMASWALLTPIVAAWLIKSIGK